MYALAIGVSHISNTLPSPVYALLSGLNSATVGVIAFAAVQLATKAITDPLSRLIVVFSACAGLCYNALWYFPILMIAGGTSTVVWDRWARNAVGKLRRWGKKPRHEEEILEMPQVALPSDPGVAQNVEDDEYSRKSINSTNQRVQPRHSGPSAEASAKKEEDTPAIEEAIERPRPEVSSNVGHVISAKLGLVVIIVFFGTS